MTRSALYDVLEAGGVARVSTPHRTQDQQPRRVCYIDDVTEPEQMSSDPLPRILIVDDTRENRELVEDLLLGFRCELQMAYDGVTALAIAAHQHPDLILCDVMMPGLTGYQVVSRLRADPATRDIPVIICSSLDDPNSRSHAISVGADDVLEKPLTRAVLLPCLELWLTHGRRSADS